jgi:hypothetical protein
MRKILLSLLMITGCGTDDPPGGGPDGGGVDGPVQDGPPQQTCIGD